MRGFAILASFCLATCACSTGPSFPYQDTRLSVDKRAEDLLRRLTPAEKKDILHTVKLPAASTTPDLEATWNPELVTQLGRALAPAAPAFEVRPLDPWLESRIAVAWVSGVQSEGGIAVMRNLPCTNEIDLQPFRAAVEEAGLWAIDAGKCADDTALLIDTIERGWGFRGFAFANGQPAPPGTDPTDFARRVLRARFASGAFDPATPPMDPAERQRIERMVAEQSVVLLRNDDGLLPLYATGHHTIGVTGTKQQIDAIRARAGSTTVVENGKGEVNVVFSPDGRIKVSNPIATALLQAGDSQGATDAIFGDVNPSGKLTQDSGDYPFGFGLSYTTFEWTDLRIFPATPRYGQTVQVVVKVANTGPSAGAETVEVYVRGKLKAFRHVEFKAGESKEVSLTLDRRAMSFYDTTQHDWAIEPGVFDVALGTSSRDIRLKGSFQLFP
jgi:hypothetical protein